MFAPIAYRCCVRQPAGAGDRSLAARPTGRRSPTGCAPSARSKRCPRSRRYAYEHPGRSVSRVRRRRRRCSTADGLGHPLMPGGASRAQRRPARRRARPHVLVVSGSNMSGKSTLLRAVGVNVVLALAGAPVRAAAAAPVAARARRDAAHRGLAAGRARRASMPRSCASAPIVDAARGRCPLLFLLDEILHGTNSHDRRIGAEAIVRGARRARRRSAW